MIKIKRLMLLFFVTLFTAVSGYAQDVLEYKGHALLYLNHVYAYKNNGALYPEKIGACHRYFQKIYGRDQLEELVTYDINLSSMIMRANAIINYVNYNLEPLGTLPTIGFLNQIKAPDAPAVYFKITINPKNKMFSGNLVHDSGDNYQCDLST